MPSRGPPSLRWQDQPNGGGSHDANSRPSSSGLERRSSSFSGGCVSGTVALFHHHLAKIRKHTNATSSDASALSAGSPLRARMHALAVSGASGRAARARLLWRIAISAVQFSVRLRLSSLNAVRLSPEETESLTRAYWECSQAAPGGSLNSEEAIMNLLQVFHQPQPPHTLEELLRYVRYNVEEAAGNAITFWQVHQIFLFLKREHVAKARATGDEDEALYRQLAAVTASSSSDGPLSSQGAAVDATAITSILKQFDLRVASPEAFSSDKKSRDAAAALLVHQSSSNALKTQGGGAAAPTRSKSRSDAPIAAHAGGTEQHAVGGGQAMPPSPAMLTLDEFKEFLHQSSSAPGRSGLHLDNDLNAWELPSNDASSLSSPIATHPHRSESKPPVPSAMNTSLRSQGATVDAHAGNKEKTSSAVGARDSSIPKSYKSVNAAWRRQAPHPAAPAASAGGASLAAASLRSAQASGMLPQRNDCLDEESERLHLFADGHSAEFIDLKTRLSRTLSPQQRQQQPSSSTGTESGGQHPEAAALQLEIQRATSSVAWRLQKRRPATAKAAAGASRDAALTLYRSECRTSGATPTVACCGGPRPSRAVQAPSMPAASLFTSATQNGRPRHPPSSGEARSEERQNPISRHRSASAPRSRSHQPIVPASQVLPSSYAASAPKYTSHVPYIAVEQTIVDTNAPGAAHADGGEASPVASQQALRQQRPWSAASSTRPLNRAPSASPYYAAHWPEPSRPASASAVRRRLDLTVKPTPLESLCGKPSFRITDDQQERLASWYQLEYLRLQPTSKASDDSAFKYSDATIELAASVHAALASSAARDVNDVRATDPSHALNPLTAFLHERTLEHHRPGSDNGTTSAAYRRPQSALERQAAMSRPTDASVLSAPHIGPVWLPGSSYAVAMRQRRGVDDPAAAGP